MAGKPKEKSEKSRLGEKIVVSPIIQKVPFERRRKNYEPVASVYCTNIFASVMFPDLLFWS